MPWPRPRLPNKRASRRLMPLGLLLMLPLAGCSTLSTGTLVTDTSCHAFRPITYASKSDTPETVKQIREHNAAWLALCSGAHQP